MKYLTTKQLCALHNDNEKVVILMGNDLAGNKALIRNELYIRKPRIFGNIKVR